MLQRRALDRGQRGRRQIALTAVGATDHRPVADMLVAVAVGVAVIYGISVDAGVTVGLAARVLVGVGVAADARRTFRVNAPLRVL
jgi:hypothetical protein